MNVTFAEGVTRGVCIVRVSREYASNSLGVLVPRCVMGGPSLGRASRMYCRSSALIFRRVCVLRVILFYGCWREVRREAPRPFRGAFSTGNGCGVPRRISLGEVASVTSPPRGPLRRLLRGARQPQPLWVAAGSRAGVSAAAGSLPACVHGGAGTGGFTAALWTRPACYPAYAGAGQTPGVRERGHTSPCGFL